MHLASSTVVNSLTQEHGGHLCCSAAKKGICCWRRQRTASSMAQRNLWLRLHTRILPITFKTEARQDQHGWSNAILRLVHKLRSNAIHVRCYATKDAIQNRPGQNAVVLVESPAKARKIQEYLGDKYQVIATYGHVRDLSTKSGSVDPENNFSMKWQTMESSRDKVKAIVEAVKSNGNVLLATDPDREGEAIGWHLVEELKLNGAFNDATKASRIVFTEITKTAVLNALDNPRKLSQPLIEAYMARRALDYLFGYNLSPLLWRKLPGARSAGRVQSVALRLISEKESEIESFIPMNYWTIEADVSLPDKSNLVTATLVKVDGKPVPKPGFTTKEEVEDIVKCLRGCEYLIVNNKTSREKTRNPLAPFNTSSLQQDANRLFGFSASRTMQLAQKLYESGYITYMRTDGVQISPEIVKQIRSVIFKDFGKEFVSDSVRMYSTKAKNAQEAHEAIRPTNIMELESSLDLEDSAAHKLYSLIRKRTLASQMSSARILLTSIDLQSPNERFTLRITASRTTFDGYQALYNTTSDLEESENTNSQKDILSGSKKSSALARFKSLECLVQGQELKPKSVDPINHTTKPPSRFTEGTLVKTMETLGIGRPSTYASTLKLLQARKYIIKKGKYLHAEPLGRILNTFLKTYFPKWVDYEFTSRLEEGLDNITNQSYDRNSLLKDFWDPFKKDLDHSSGISVRQVIELLNDDLHGLLWGNEQDGDAISEASLDDGSSIKDGRKCPICGSNLSLKLSSKGGPFVGCSSYPSCLYSRPIIDSPLLPENENDSTEIEKKSEQLEGQSFKDAAKLSSEHNIKGLVQVLGKDSNGNNILVRIGPYGAYLQVGLDSEPIMRRFPLPKRLNPKNVSRDYAIALISLPRELGKHPETGLAITVNNGTYGPYISHGNMRRSVPHEIDPSSIQLEDVLNLIRAKDGKAASEAMRAAEKVAPSNLSHRKRGRRRENKDLNPKNSKSSSSDSKIASSSGPNIKILNINKKGQKRQTRIPQRRSTWNYFVREHGPELKGLDKTQRAKILSEIYKSISDEEKSRYQHLADLDNERASLQEAGLLGMKDAIEYERYTEKDRVDLIENLKNSEKKSKANLSPYHIFMAEKAKEFRQMKEQNRDGEQEKRGSFVAMISQMWRALSAEEKQKYIEKSQQNK